MKRELGDIGDDLAVEIIASGATIGGLQEVAAHLASETDVMGKMERPLSSRALRIYTTLRQAAADWDEQD